MTTYNQSECFISKLANVKFGYDIDCQFLHLTSPSKRRAVNRIKVHKPLIRWAIIFSVIRLGDKFSSKISPNIGCRLGNFVNYDSLSKICSGVHVSTFWKKLYFLLEHLVALVLLMTRCMNVV